MKNKLILFLLTLALASCNESPDAGDLEGTSEPPEATTTEQPADSDEPSEPSEPKGSAPKGSGPKASADLPVDEELPEKSDAEPAPRVEEEEGIAAVEEGPMNGAQLESILREVAKDKIVVEGSVIEFVVEGIPIACVYDEAHDRMRLITPIKSFSEVTDEEKDAMLRSNFHSALDGRYAVSGDIVYAAFIHPLSSLTKYDFLSGIFQVASLRASFGDSYSSGLLQYGGETRGESA
ncbi:MAG: hypothetical protein AAF236_16030 [Verrucomicrobiota bacterium]